MSEPPVSGIPFFVRGDSKLKHIVAEIDRIETYLRDNQGGQGEKGDPGPAGPPGPPGPEGPQGEPGEASEGGVTTSGVWQLTAPDVIPGGTQVSLSDSTTSAATWARFAAWDKKNVDFKGILMALQDGDRIYAQQQMESDNWAKFTVSGTPTDMGNYVQVPISYLNGSGGGSTAMWQACLVIFAL